MSYAFILLLWVPVAILLWRMAVSKQGWPVRVGAATTAMLGFVGSLTAPPASGNFRIDGEREWAALAISAAAPAYLLLWSQLHGGRGSSRTISLIAVIVGLVPIAAALTLAVIYAE
jgi:hypothetical protein